MVLYADIYLAVNLVMNFLILLAVVRATGYRAALWRLAVAALFGAAYSLGQFYSPWERLYGAPGKLLATLLLTAIASWPLKAAAYLRFTLLFLFFGFLVAGAGLGLAGFLTFSPNRLLPWWLLVLAVTMVFALGRGGWIYLGDRNRERSFLLDLGISFAGREVRMRALVDTGNRLREPFFGKPVVIVSGQQVWGVLPREITAAMDPGGRFQDGIELADLSQAFAQSPWADRFRAIPFAGINDRGILGGFKPDQIRVYGRKGVRLVHGVVAIANGADFAGDGWEALVSPDFLRSSS
ncbi:MAG: sigma-E processing peptidase SpoIIGA [Firmicutes bacterium]|nr:sigma-E processing peptidase SpoIIGA [Bacillota bacterium]MCL5040789.1 sigma-E processing peptidase SpoIIGA [Bacillota bacterium]